MRIYTGLPILLFLLVWNFTVHSQPCINSFNNCAPAYETTVISPVNAFPTVYWQSAQSSYRANFTFSTRYKIVMSHASGAYLLSNVQMRFDSDPIDSDVPFQYTGGFFNLTGYIAGNALPGTSEELKFEVYERNWLGIYYKGITFKFTLTVTCANNLVVLLPTTKNTSSIGKYESNGYMQVSAPQTHTGTGQLNFDAQNYVEFLPGSALTVTNGSMEAYIDGCGGVKSGTIGEEQAEQFSALETDINVSLSPNPTTGRALVSFDDYGNEKHVVLYDASGRLLQEKVTDQQQLELDIADQPGGVYFLHVTVNGQHQVLKMLRE